VYSPHWFVFHDENGAVDTTVTWQPGGLPRSDVELAMTVAGMSEAAGCPLLYGAQSHTWYALDGSGRYAPQDAVFASAMTRRIALWHAQATADVLAAVRAEIAAMPPEFRARAEKAAERNWAPHRSYRKRLWDDAGQHAIASQLAAAFACDESGMDAGTGRIIVDNGVIDADQVLADGYVRLLPHDSSDLVSRRTGAGVRWDPQARCDAFERFTRESVRDEEQRDWLLWRTACALFGRMPRKGFVNVIGARDSGKSTYTSVIDHIAGDYARSVPVETFLSKHAGDQGFRQHELMGVRFVHTHEPNASALYDVAFMKTLTGRDRQRTRTMYQRYISWFPQCTPFIGSNNPIRFSTADDAMVTRLEAVLFERGYDRPDDFLLARLQGEASGILRLLVSYIERESRQGTPELPATMIALRERMAEATEDALEFVAEWLADGRLRAEDDAPAYRCARVGALYQHYRYWCEEAGVKPVGRKTFAAVIGRKYPRSQSGGFWHFTGLASA
jgi:P4 family phage/plasmid primase-like protien